MTCIAGVAHQGKVYVGGDSAGLAGWDLVSRADEKVFAIGEFVFGFTDSFRMGQLLRYSLAPPSINQDACLERYMATDFVDAVRECLRKGGYARKTNEAEAGGQFLVGVRGRLFAVHEDYQVAESRDGYDAIGCGHAYAKGALAVTEDQPPEKRLRAALSVAERHSGGVRGPFVLVKTKGEVKRKAQDP